MKNDATRAPSLAMHEMAPHRRNTSILYPIIFVGLLIISRYLFPSKMTLLIEVGIFAIYVMGNNVLMGYLGLVSFGQPFYLSAGAYSAALYLAHIGHNIYIAMGLSLVTGVLLSLIFGPSFIRLRSSYFTLINASLCAMGVFLFEKILIGITNGNDGLWYRKNMHPTPILNLRSTPDFFIFTMIVLFIFLLLYRQLDRSALGAIFRGTRINERKMEFIGFNTFKVRWLGFTLASVMSCFAGSLYAINLAFVNPSLGENSRAIEVVVATLIGGVGTLYGGLFGALGFLGIKDIVSNFVSRWELIVGIITLLVLFRMSGGLWGFVSSITDKISRKRTKRLAQIEASTDTLKRGK
ncbi:MAG: branched-chain amino acid ABC transporter permease [Sphaerochaetaceae bacterium]